MELTSQSIRINLLKIPLDILDENELESKIISLLENKRNNQIVFLDFKNFIRGRNNKEYRNLLNNAALVLPSSTLLTKGIYFLFKRKATNYINYDCLLKILNILEKHKKSIYIIGSNKKNINISERNLRDSYPGLQLVGRCSSKYQKSDEKNILTAIKKSSPSLLIAGSGLKGSNKWLYNNKSKFNPGLTLWSSNCFEIFSGRKKRPSKSRSKRFFLKIKKALISPWKILYIIPLITYYLTLLVYKIFKLS